MMNYPSSIPEYNKLRFLTTDSIDIEDKGLLCICAPQALIKLLVGAMSLLSDVNSWESYGTLTEIDMVDLINNEVIMNDCCTILTSALEDCPEFGEGILDILINSDVFNDHIKQLIQQMLTGGTGAYGALAEVNDLDYVWGGLLYALNEYEDALGEFSIAAQGVTDIVEYLSNIPTIGPLKAGVLESVDAAIGLGIAVVETYLNDNDTKNNFLCGIFDQICGRGPTYGILPEDINAGWAAMDAGAGNPLLTISDLVSMFFSNDKFIQLFGIGSDTPDNNWESLCNCQQPDHAYFEPYTGGTLPQTTILKGQWAASGGTGVSPGCQISQSTLYNGKWYEEADVKVDFGVDAMLGTIDVDVFFQVSGGGGTDFGSCVLRAYNEANTQVFTQQINKSEGQWYNVHYDVNTVCSRFTIEFTSGSATGPQTGQTRVDNILVQ